MKAGGNQTQFFPTDGTNGLQNSGNITFNAPGDWTKDDEAEVNGDITNAYYIKIVRTKNGVYTQPIENYSPLLPHFHIVEAHNHRKIRMSGSNYGDNTKWMYGVPIQHLGISQRGTSVASAIYAGLLSRNNSEKFLRRARKVVGNIFADA